MMAEEAVEAAARYLFETHEERRPFDTWPTDLVPENLQDAYLVQDALVALWRQSGRGELGGYKVALTTPQMQAYVGVDQPCAGCIFRPEIHASPAIVNAADYVNLGIECEIALRIGSDLPGDGAPYTRDGVAASVAAVAPAFELIDDRGSDYPRLSAPLLAADNSWNAGVVLGPEVGDWQGLDLGTITGRLGYNGEAAGEGRGSDALGHPLEALAWLANHLAERSQTLNAGMIVMTGSIIKTRFPKPADEARFAVEGLGEVEVTVR